MKSETQLLNQKFKNMKIMKIRLLQGIMTLLLMTVVNLSYTYAHCDSYDGPVIKEALQALESDNVTLLLKWINEDQEEEIISLFNKTHDLRSGDAEIYTIIEKHFLETLVRLHRETEGEPFTGLKPAGSVEPIISMADESLVSGDFDHLSQQLTAHIAQVLKEKHKKALELSQVKDDSVEQGRAYVAAYVDYTHTLEGIHKILTHGPEGHGAEHNIN